mgnify:CR=1 FL=1
MTASVVPKPPQNIYNMRSDIVIIGAGASGLMAAYGAAREAVDSGVVLQVTVLEKMPRPARKVMITGKGRCNFTNVKDWNEFQSHIRTNPNFVKTAFYSFDPRAVLEFFEGFGMHTVVDRGDRAFPASYHSTDVVDTLVSACRSLGVKIETESEVTGVAADAKGGFELTLIGGGKYLCKRLIIATGGLSYPGTGSTGDGYLWAQALGHSIRPCFPSLTALVPKGYKVEDVISSQGRWHIDRSTPLSALGQALCGQQLKNVGVSLYVGDALSETEVGDLDFTDGGIEGPIGFQISRKAVKSLINGSRLRLSVDLKPGVPLEGITARVKELWQQVDKDPRSVRLREKEKCRILLGKLLPWELIPGFLAANPGIMTLERRSRTDTKVWVNLPTMAKALKDWSFEIVGYVGYERCVVTAGGVSTDEVVPKTMASRICPGLYLCGEVLDIDADTGGYNLQLAFCTGRLAGRSSAAALV